MMKKDSNRYRMEPKNRAMHWMVPVLFLCSSLISQAATNWVDGLAYGTNDWSTAGSISSQTNGSGSLVVGYDGTTNLTLLHDIEGYVNITNKAISFKVDAAGATVTGSEGAVFSAVNTTNLVITGGRFIGTASTGSGGGPPLPGLEGEAIGGYITNSAATISESEFAGIGNAEGFVMERSTLTISNGMFRGGDSGTGLFVGDNSMVTIHSGSFTGGVSHAAVYLENSDATIHGGTFAGNIGGTSTIVGDGLFSILTEVTTNSVNLHGGTFSSLAFYSTNGAVQHFLAGTNLIVQNGIYQNGGTVVVDNQTNSALQQIHLQDGTMEFGNDFTLTSNGVFSLENGTMEFGNDFSLDPGSEFNLYQSQLVVADDMAFASDSFMEINTSTTGGYVAITADTATFQTNSTLTVDASDGGFASETNDLNIIETTSGIFVGAIGATTENFNSNVNLTVTTDWLSMFDGAFITNGGNALRIRLITQTWREGWEAEGQLGELADELQDLDDGTMAAAISSMDKESSKQAVEETYFTVRNTFQTVLHGMQAAVGQSVSRGAEYREQLKLKSSGSRKQRQSMPLGAGGPQRSNDMRGWAKYYGQRYSHDADGLNPEYDTDLDGGVVGVDKSLGSLLVGISGGYGRYSTTTGIDGEEDITAYHGSLYGTLGIGKAYIDAGVAYGFNQVENQTTSPFVLNGEFDAQILSTYLGGGIDLVDSKEGMVFTPEASIQYSMYEQDAYSETSDTAVPRNIDAFDADSLCGSIGLNVSVQETMKFDTFGLKYDVRAHWIREFNPEPGNMNFSLAGGTDPYELAVPMLDEDLYRVGIGCSFFNTKRNQPKNVMFRIDFDELFGDGFNSHNFSAKVLYAF